MLTIQILRNDNGVTINIHAVGLNPHHAYTAWIAEIGVPGKATFLTGHIVGGSCESTTSGRLGLNSDPKPAQNPLGGEFHVIIADHGPLDELDPPLPAAIKTPLGSTWTHVVIFKLED